MRIHAICIALNEQDFITEFLKSMYPFCSGISLITQYIWDNYCKLIIANETVKPDRNYN